MIKLYKNKEGYLEMNVAKDWQDYEILDMAMVKTRKMEKCYFSKTRPTNNMDTKKFSRKVEKC